VGRLVEELAIVSPKLIVVMGEDALFTLGELDIPLSRELEPVMGQIQSFTPTVEVLHVPNIDDALDEDSAKRQFWSAFRALGQWWADLPPY
jgi:uracil-DNA glycosylase